MSLTYDRTASQWRDFSWVVDQHHWALPDSLHLNKRAESRTANTLRPPDNRHTFSRSTRYLSIFNHSGNDTEQNPMGYRRLPAFVTHWPAALRPFHRACGMWNFCLWINWAQNFLHKALWMTVEILTVGCGKKVAAALGQKPLFHISSY